MPTRRMLTTLGLFFCLALVGCDGGHDAAMQEVVDSMESMNDVLAEIETPEDAEASYEDVAAAMDRLNAAGTKVESLEPPSQEESQALMQEYGEPLEEAAQAFFGHMVRLGGNGALEPLRDLFEDSDMGGNQGATPGLPGGGF